MSNGFVSGQSFRIETYELSCKSMEMRATSPLDKYSQNAVLYANKTLKSEKDLKIYGGRIIVIANTGISFMNGFTLESNPTLRSSTNKTLT